MYPETRRYPSNRRLNEHGIYIRLCQESNSQPVPSQAGADTTRRQWRTKCYSITAIPNSRFPESYSIEFHNQALFLHTTSMSSLVELHLKQPFWLDPEHVWFENANLVAIRHSMVPTRRNLHILLLFFPTTASRLCERRGQGVPQRYCRHQLDRPSPAIAWEGLIRQPGYRHEHRNKLLDGWMGPTLEWVALFFSFSLVVFHLATYVSEQYFRITYSTRRCHLMIFLSTLTKHTVRN